MEMRTEKCRVRGSETAEANRPGYEDAAHEKQGSILAEGGDFVLKETELDELLL